MQEYFIIFLPAFILGMLHTFIPCEDKAILFFWSLGIAKEAKKSVFILALYGLGLMTANLIIASGTILISLIPRIILPNLIFDPHLINFFGSLTSMFASTFFLFFITRRDYMPHSKSKEIHAIQEFNWARKRTPYLLGILAGFPPCVFELLIYSQCLVLSLSYGFLQGFLIVLYFSLGTFIGLFPLAFAKQGASHIIGKESKQKNRIFFLMILLIISFNTIIMVLSFLRIPIFPVGNL